MEKTIIDERNSWEYELTGEQYYPAGRVIKDGHLHPGTVDNNNTPDEEKRIGVWGQRHLRFIKQYKKNLHFELYVSGQLNGYLAEIEAQAEEMFFRLVKELSVREGVTEAMKAEDQMYWVRSMNNIQNRAREIVNRELIFA